MTTKWIISNLECKNTEGNTNIVTAIHWRIVGSIMIDEKLCNDDLCGVTEISEADPENFIEFQNLTENDIINWLGLHIDIADILVSLEDKIQHQTTTLKPPF